MSGHEGAADEGAAASGSAPAPGAPAELDTVHRVKVYKLNQDGHWDDKGTGHVAMERLDGSCPGLVVIADDMQTLLIHRVSREDIYQRQHASIMTWSDPSMGTDIALSFQQPTGCNAIWARIEEARQELTRRPASPEGRQDDVMEDVPSPRQSELPPIEPGTLPDVAKMLAEASVFQRERIASQVVKENAVRKLLDVFGQMEDLEDADSLQACYWAVRGLIMLNDSRVFESLFSDQNILDVIGALEYDPELPTRQNHREFLRTRVAFKEVVPIKDPSITAKIHLSYRIGYIKDVILARTLDDAVFASLSSLVLLNNIEVVSALMADDAFVAELFDRLRALQPSEGGWRDLVAFLQELCALSKHLQVPAREGVMSKLQGMGLFEVLSSVMQHGEPELKLRATDILMSVVDQDAAPLRAFIVQSDAGKDLLAALVAVLQQEDPAEVGLQEQTSELLRSILDVGALPPLTATDEERTNSEVVAQAFLHLFYERHARTLAEMLEQDPKGQWAVPPGTVCLILELFCFCLQHHGMSSKYFAMSTSLVKKALRLVHARQQWVAAAAVRFVRVLVGIQDPFFPKHLVSADFLSPLADVLLSLGDRYNLLSSSILDVFEFLARDSPGHEVLDYVASTCLPRLEKEVTYCGTFRALRAAVNGQPVGGAGGLGCAGLGAGAGMEGSETRAAPAAPATGSMRGEGRGVVREAVLREARGLDRDEEAWFSSEDEPDEAPGADARAGSLGSGRGGGGGLALGWREVGPRSTEEGRGLGGGWRVAGPSGRGTGDGEGGGGRGSWAGGVATGHPVESGGGDAGAVTGDPLQSPVPAVAFPLVSYDDDDEEEGVEKGREGQKDAGAGAASGAGAGTSGGEGEADGEGRLWGVRRVAAMGSGGPGLWHRDSPRVDGGAGSDAGSGGPRKRPWDAGEGPFGEEERDAWGGRQAQEGQGAFIGPMPRGSGGGAEVSVGSRGDLEEKRARVGSGHVG